MLAPKTACRCSLMSIPPNIEAMLGELSTLVHSTTMASTEREIFDAMAAVSTMAYEISLACRAAHNFRMEDIRAERLAREAAGAAPSGCTSLSDLGLD